MHYKISLTTFFSLLFLSVSYCNTNHAIPELSPEYFQKLTSGFDNSLKAAAYVEGYYINAFGNFVKRSNECLFLKLDSHKYLVFTNTNPGNDGSQKYLFQYLYNDIGYYYIYVQHYEGCSQYLISKKNGKIFSVYSMPYFTANKQYFLSFNTDFAGYTPNIIALYKIKNGKIIKLDQILPKNWGPYFIKWIDDYSFIFRKFDGKKLAEKEIIGKIVKDKIVLINN